MNSTGIKLKYSEIVSENMMRGIYKSASASVNGHQKYSIAKVYRAFKKAKEEISKKFDAEIVEKFIRRNEDGTRVGTLTSDDHMAGHGFALDPEKVAEFEEAKKAFGENEAILECRPLTEYDLQEVSLSALELDGLGPLFLPSEIPSVPGPGAAGPVLPPGNLKAI